jgi:internalin A
MSELALRLIEENKKTKAPFLDLGNCGLTEVPAEIAELAWLEELSFSTRYLHWSDNEHRTRNTGPSNNIAHLSNSLSQLYSLKRLRLSGRGGEHFALSDLSALAELSGLQILDISETDASDLQRILYQSVTPNQALKPLEHLLVLKV